MTREELEEPFETLTQDVNQFVDLGLQRKKRCRSLVAMKKVKSLWLQNEHDMGQKVQAYKPHASKDFSQRNLR